MRNFYALSFVLLVLGACAQYTYTNTHARLGNGDSSQWDNYVKRGGAFHGLD